VAGRTVGEPQATSTALAQVLAVDAVTITVADIDRAVRFYQGVLDFEKVSDVELHGDSFEHLYGVFGMRARVVRLRLGTEHVQLVDFLAPEGRPIQAMRSNDRAFQHIAIVVSDMAAAYARLREHDVQHASSGPQRLPDSNPSAGGIEAFYFKDPDGHFLEIIHFPPGKASPRWQDESRLFLGIDHTAIVVQDTDRSLGFYRDTLGFKVAGASENHGPEQERLNGVFGARLRITSLAPPKGPSVELLEYLAPSDGQPMPSDTRANDLWHWHIRMEVQGADAALRRAKGMARWVSPGAVTVEPILGLARGAMVRDADGHAILFFEQGPAPPRLEATP
jgi:catechol 2,3-dioxygenase-like lactoylglutathione lyase family enzyme